MGIWFLVDAIWQNFEILPFPFQVLLRAAGPEEMKWAQKGLYTYNVRDGDSFILDEKVPLPKLKTNAKANSAYSTSPKVYGNSPIFPTAYLNQHSRNSVTFGMISPKQMMGRGAAAPKGKPNVSRNLFGGGEGGPPEAPEANNNNVTEKNSNQQWSSWCAPPCLDLISERHTPRLTKATLSAPRLEATTPSSQPPTWISTSKTLWPLRYSAPNRWWAKGLTAPVPQRAILTQMRRRRMGVPLKKLNQQWSLGEPHVWISSLQATGYATELSQSWCFSISHSTKGKKTKDIWKWKYSPHFTEHHQRDNFDSFENIHSEKRVLW